MPFYKVYVSGPLTTGDPMINVQNALKASKELMERGYVPFVPHLTYFWETLYSPFFSYEDWMDWDLEWLNVCDLMLRLPGESPGADREEMYAADHNIPVFYDINKLAESYS